MLKKITEILFDRIILYSISIVFFCFFLYSNTITNEYAIDDELVVENNTQIAKGIKGIPEIFSSYYVEHFDHEYGYRPITKATYAIEYSIFGKNPSINHLFNVIFYSLLCLLIFLIFRKIFHLNEKSSLFLFLSVLLFASHPIHTEVVASLKNREEILCFIFGLTSMYFFSNITKKKIILNTISGLLFLILSILTKQSGVVFAGLIILQIYFFSFRSDSEKSFDLKLSCIFKKYNFKFENIKSGFIKLKNRIISKKNFSLILSLVLLLTIIVTFLSVKIPYDKFPAKAEVQNWQNPAYMDSNLREEMFLESNYFYLSKLIYPHPLLFYYGYNMFPVETGFYLKYFISIIVLVLLMAIALLYLRNKHIVSYSVLFYFIALSPVLNVVIPIAGIVGERLVFVASWGFCLFVVFFLFKIFSVNIVNNITSKIKQSGLSKTLMFIVFGAIFTSFSFITINRNKDWKDKLTLVEADLPYLENSFFANSFYASLLEEKYENNRNPETLQKIIKHYKKASEIYSEDDISLNNLGRIYVEELFIPDSAIYFLNKSLNINPENASAYFNLGVIFESIGNFRESKESYLNCLRTDSSFYNATLMLANLYFYRFSLEDSAIYYNNQVIIKDKYNEAPYFNLGNYKLTQKDTLGAILYYETAFEINPGNYENAKNLYNYFKTHNNQEKTKYYEKFLNIKPL